ncbi:MAG: amino acid ABC transporter substrate-binding protein [Termitinemataceae bacterium]|nr:MAG: amino acid ABC transporter substrate-binding protein [Termitinemataceae bacterium]
MRKIVKKVSVLFFMLIVVQVFAFAQGKNKAGTALERIKSAGVIKVGIEGTYPPYTFHDAKNNIVGYDVEIAREIAEKIGVKVEFVESSWDSLIAGVDSGRWDVVINQVGINPERKKKYDFSTPYTYTRGALVVHSDSTIKSFADLKGKKSAQTVTSNWAQVAEKNGAEIIGTVSGFNESVRLVESKRADATINDDVTFYDYKKTNPKSPTKVVAFATEITTDGVLLPKKEPKLLQAINQALKELGDSGKLSEISNKYFAQDISIPPK